MVPGYHDEPITVDGEFELTRAEFRPLNGQRGLIQPDFCDVAVLIDCQLLGSGERASDESALGCEGQLEYVLPVDSKYPRAVEVGVRLTA